MNVLLLVAGRSRRFWPLEEKSLWPIAGKTLLAHQLERLAAAGCTNVTVVSGKHNLDAIRGLFPSLTLIEQEDLEKGMQGALLSALPKMSGDPLLIVSGNDIIEPKAYEDLIAAARHGDGAILAQKVSRYFPGGYLTLDGDRIRGIVEKPGEGKEPSDLVTIVAHIHNDPASLLTELRRAESTNDDGYEQSLEKLFAAKNYRAVPYTGFWQAVKYPWHLLSLLPSLLEETVKLKRIDPSAVIHPTAVVEGDVILEAGVKLLPHATVRGPCFIGKNTIVGTGALVRASSVGENCVIGYQTEVKGSILERDVWTHMTYLGDSIIARNVSFGGGTITGNFRLDEAEVLSVVGDDNLATGLTKLGAIVGEGCRIGIQVGTNPGVKIGRGTFVAGGAYVTGDIPDRSFVSLKDGKLLVRENRAAVANVEERNEYRAILERKTP